MFGGIGNDRMEGGTGADYLDGGRNIDILFGGDGDDALRGGRGRDTIDGGEGDDNLYGGSSPLGDGAVDTFVFAATANGRDRIKDFEDGLDQLDLSDLGFADFDAVLAATDQFASGNLRIAFNGTDQVVIENFLLSDFDASDVILS